MAPTCRRTRSMRRAARRPIIPTRSTSCRRSIRSAGRSRSSARWFFDSRTPRLQRSTRRRTISSAAFEQIVGGVPSRPLAGLESDRAGLSGDDPAASGPGGNYQFVYGGTPSDPSIVRCIQDLKARGFRVVFYPFLLGTATGYPLARADHLRGRRFRRGDGGGQRLPRRGGDGGSSRRDAVNLTVAYSGYLFDWTYRRMILHYANLCVIAGGVEPVRHRLRAARASKPSAARPGPRPGRRTARATRSGTIRSSPASSRSPTTCAASSTARG